VKKMSPGVINMMDQNQIEERAAKLREAEATLRRDWWATQQQADALLKELNTAIRTRVDWEELQYQENLRIERARAKLEGNSSTDKEST
jgi:hypothetical protein